MLKLFPGQREEPRQPWPMGIRYNTRLGFKLGGGAGILVALAVGVWNIIRGGAPVTYYGLTYPVLALVYVAGGAMAGTIMGLLRPLAQWHIGAMAVGALSMTPLYFGVAIAIDGLPSRWEGASWFSAILCSVVVGGMLGNQWWKSYGP